MKIATGTVTITYSVICYTSGCNAAGRTVNILGDIDPPHTYAYLEDVARGLTKLADRSGTGYDLAPARCPHPIPPGVDNPGLKKAGFPPKLRVSKISGCFLDGTTDDKPLRFSYVWRKKDGQWKEIHHHGSQLVG